MILVYNRVVTWVYEILCEYVLIVYVSEKREGDHLYVKRCVFILFYGCLQYLFNFENFVQTLLFGDNVIWNK